MVQGDLQLLRGELDLLELYAADLGHLVHLPGQDLLQGVRGAVDVPLGHVSSLPVLPVGVGDSGGDGLTLGAPHLGQDAVGDGPHGHLADLDAFGVLGYDGGHGHEVLLADPGGDERSVERVEIGCPAHRRAVRDEESGGYEFHARPYPGSPIN